MSTFALLLLSNCQCRGWRTYTANTAIYKLFYNFYHTYYTNSLSALLPLLMWSLSSACPLHQCTLCASYSMRIVEWISICGTYVMAWLGDPSKHAAACQLQHGYTALILYIVIQVDA